MGASTDNSEEENVQSSHFMIQMQKENKDRRVRVDRKYACEQCNKTYASPGALWHHRKSAHESVKYACDKCDYQATQQGDIKNTLRQNMKVSSMLVISVTTKLHGKKILKDTMI